MGNTVIKPVTIDLDFDKLRNTRLRLLRPGSTHQMECVRSCDIFKVWCYQHGVKIYPAYSKSPYVPLVRTQILGGGDLPLFGGKADYTHMLWVDTDIQFEVLDFAMLYQLDKDIVCGGYLMSPRTYSVSIDDEYMIPRSRYEEYTEPFKVKWSGMGFMLIKKGVIESIERPWFVGEDHTGEDIVFCRKARKAGYDIWCEPRVRLTHWKVQPLSADLPYRETDAIIELLIREMGKDKFLEAIHDRWTFGVKEAKGRNILMKDGEDAMGKNVNEDMD